MCAMQPDDPQRVLRVQTVLYSHELRQLWRLARGLDAAARKVIDAGLIDRIEWALGDSSSSPAIDARDPQLILEGTSTALSNVTYEFFGANLGSSGGQNRLAEGHAFDYLLVLNPDTYPSPTALLELVRAFDQPHIGIVEARQLPLEHPREYDLVTGETSWASGFCMLVRRKVFDELDGFDSEHFLLHCDDVDFSWRARAAGYGVVVAPYAAVFHDKRPSPGDAWPTPDHEVYHSILGRLMLAERWGRPDIVEETIELVEADSSEVRRAALTEFRMRLATGKVPSPQFNADKIAQFVDGEYARHRF
jgi:hypothetical protein